MTFLKWLWDRINAEPVATAELFKAGLMVAVAFDLRLTPQQLAEGYVFVSMLITWLTRRATTPVNPG